MKIVQQTATQLLLREQHPCWLIALVFSPWLTIGVSPIFGIINWLSARSNVLTVGEDLVSVLLFIGEILLSVIFLISGISISVLVLWIVVSTPIVVTCSFDKSLNSLTLKQRSLFNTEVAECSIQEISGVKVQESRSTGSYGTVSISYGVTLVLVSGMRIDLISTGMSLRRAQKIANCISAFLNINN